MQQILAQAKKVAPDYSNDHIQFSSLDKLEKANARIALYNSDQMLRGENHNFMCMNSYAVEHFNYKSINTQADAGNKLINMMFSLNFRSFGCWRCFLILYAQHSLG